MNTGVAGPRSEARPRFQAECSFPGGKRQPDAKEHLERGGGEQRAGKVQVSPRSAPARPPLPAGLQRGGSRRGGGRAGGRGRCCPGPPLPQRPCRNSTRASLPGPAAPRRPQPALTARSRRRPAPPATSRVEPGKGGLRAPPPPAPAAGIRMRRAHAAAAGPPIWTGLYQEERRRRGGSHPAAGERRERARALVPETLRELQTLPRRGREGAAPLVWPPAFSGVSAAPPPAQ